ncbi:hypothetical protein P8452_76974 [Trifolium repens]|nr:anamorsin protein [Trifolium repens]WJX95687.1 hypothetical protein P8452_76974 [Trifolium repens]
MGSEREKKRTPPDPPLLARKKVASLSLSREFLFCSLSQCSLHMKYLLDCSSGLIDENSLLPEEDLKKPVLSSGNCEIGTTRKACENCSCGMVEEGEKVLKLGLTGEHINNPQSVYGSPEDLTKTLPVTLDVVRLRGATSTCIWRQ